MNKQNVVHSYNGTVLSHEKGTAHWHELDELANTLNYAKEELKQTDDLRKELLANVSHDLKTPLTMIKGYTEMVKDVTYKDDVKRNENLNKFK